MAVLNSRPVYLQVIDAIQEMIAREHKPGDRLLPEQELASRFGVSRASLREALRVLEEQGVITRRHGVGTFVKRVNPSIQSGIEELASISDLIRQMGMEPGTDALKITRETAPPWLEEKLDLTPGTEIVTLDRVRTADGQPVVYGLDRIPAELFKPCASAEDFLVRFGGALFALLEVQNIPVQWVRADIRPVLADKSLAKKLKIAPGRPLILLEQVHYDAAGRPVAFGEDYFHPDHFGFSVVRRKTERRAKV